MFSEDEFRLAPKIFEAVVDSVCRVVHVHRETASLAVGCLIANGHLLIEDYPGLGKTTLAKALANSFGVGFRRIQFTADLLPSDITGAMVFDTHSRELTFRPGPIFSNVVMADELNRASPRTQSALLEAMEERQVTVDGNSMTLPFPFLVVATQNPYDATGTSPLPHGQRDRFLLRISIGYPDRDSEDALLAGVDPATTVKNLPPAVSADELNLLVRSVLSVHVSPAARSYVLDIINATRNHQLVRVGASPRAALSLMRAARFMAVLNARTYVNPEDIQKVVIPALSHRLLVHASVSSVGDVAEEVITEILHMVPVPLVGSTPELIPS